MFDEVGSAHGADGLHAAACGESRVVAESRGVIRITPRRLGWAFALAASLLALPAWAADLQLTDLSDSGYDPVPAGSDVVYSVTLENGAGDTSASAVSLFDLPAGTTANALPAFCAADAGVPTRIVCNHGPLQGTLAGGSPVTFQIGVDTGGQPPGTVTMRGAIGFGATAPPATTPISSLTVAHPFFATDTNTSNNLRSQATTLTTAGDLRLQKSATPDPVVGGGEVTYTLTVSNDGPSASTNFRVVDTLPAATTYVASSFNGTGWTFNNGTMTATHAGTLAVGASTSFTFRARVNAGSGNITNGAIVEAIGTPDSDPGNNDANVTTSITPGADVSLSKTAAPAPAIAGQPVTFTLTARNLGPSAAENTSFTDTLPTGFVITGGTQPAGWTCVNNGSDTARTCTRGTSMPSGAVENFTIVATVPSTGPNSSGNVTNTATITSTTPDPNGPSLGTNNNNGSVTFTVLSDGADLSMTKAKTPQLVAAWDGIGSDADSRMTSTMTVRNLGPRTATGQVQVVDELAAGEEFISASGPWTCSIDNPYAAPPARQRVTCDLNAGSLPLAVNANAPQLQIISRARASGTLTNTACTGGSNGSLEPLTGGGINNDPVTGNDCSGAGTRTTDERADLSITKQTNGPGTADNVLTASQNSLTYTLTVTNNGPDATTGIVVNDPIPGFVTGRTLVTATTVPANWTCATGGTVICRSNTTSLASGASAVIVLTVQRALFDSAGLGAGSCGGAPTSNAFCNTAGVGIDAAVSGSVGEINAANNSGSDWLQIDRVANVQTTAKNISSGATGQAGVNTTYVMSFRNQGPSSVPGVVFRDVFTLPADDAGFVLVSATRTGGGTAACTATPGPGITTAPASGGTSYANPTGGTAQVTLTCVPLQLNNGQTESMTVVIRPNVNIGNTGRTFTNVADFYFDRNNDGTADPASGTDANGSFNFNTDTTAGDDSRSATLPFGSGTVDLITNKVDVGFSGGVDPLGYNANDITQNLITYQITVRNNGPSLATNVRLADTITPQPGRTVRYVGASATPGGPYVVGACAVAAGSNPTVAAPMTLDCQMPGIGFTPNQPGVVASGQTSTLYIRFQYETAPGAAGDTLANTVDATSAETDTNPANNSADQDTTIRARADVGVAKTMVVVAPDSDPTNALPPTVTSVALRQPFFYVIDGINNGPGASLSLDRTGTSPLNGTGTVVTDTLPANVLVTGAITWQKVGPDPGGGEQPDGTGTCAIAGSTVTCNVGDVTASGRVRIIVPARWDTYPAGGTSNNTATIATQQVDPIPGNNTTTVPLAVTRSSLEGVVFEDRDRAGANGGTRQSAAAEPAIAGVTVTLTGTDAYGNAVNRTATTAADGTYRFDNLSPANASGYTLTQTQPAGYVNSPSAPPTTGGSEPSVGGTYSAGSPNSVIAAIPVGANDTGVRYNFPEVRRPSLSGFVYIDGNFSNVREGSDGAIAGATVELLDAGTGTVVATATTNASGAYSFPNLDPLIVYTLREVLPTGSYQNRPTAVNPGQIGGAPCATGCTPGTGVAGDATTTDRISSIDLGAGTDGTVFNFGEDAVAGISGSVYVDRDNNGNFDAGDAGTVNSRPNGGLQGIDVTLTGAGADGIFGNGDDPAPVTVQTDATGAYQFTGLVVGQNYRVAETQPAGYANGTENAGNLVTITGLAPAGSSGNDFGERLGSLAGVVYEDFSTTAANNNNGAFDGGENPIANATVTLTGTDLLGNAVNVVVQTDAAGAYVFRDLLPPQAATTYTITETQPTGYIDGRHTPGNAATPGNATTANVIDGIAINAGQAATGYLFGELANAIISGTVYLDRNDNGDQNAGESGIPGVTVVIQGAGPDGVFGNGDDLPPVTLTTDANGGYSYGGAITGQSYRIVETQPTGLADGQENASNTITLTNLPAAGSSGNDFGELAASLSGNVWLDADNDGVRDAGENGIAGVTVNLPAGTVDALGNTVTAAVTDANGDYRFIDLLAGTYAVTEQAVQPVVGGVTTLNGTTVAGTVGGAGTGSATAVATVPSAVTGIVLPPGGASVQNNFGETLGVSLAGRVFFDADNDGAQSGAAETGIDGVTITLTGTDDTGAAVSVSTTTDANGDYRFDGLRPGTYTVTEPQQPTGTSNGQTVAGTVGGASSGNATPITTVPSVIAGINLTTPGSASINNLFGEIPLNSAISGRVWQDTDNDGVIDPSEQGIGNVVVRLTGTDLAGNTITRDVTTLPDGRYAFTDLPPGTYTLTEPDQPAGTLNGTTVPGTAGGTATPPTVAPSVIGNVVLGVGEEASDNNFGEVPAGVISGRVYNDGNNNGVIDAGEGGFPNVQVVLTGTNELGETVNVTVTTDGDGRYRFDDLRPGTYTVTEPTQPQETLNGITSAGTIDGTSVGTATPVATTPSAISAIVLPPGGQSIDNNFGEIGDSPDLVVSKTATPTTFTVNNTGTYTIRVRNIGQQPSLGEYVVEDRLPTGLALAATPAGNGWVCTGAAGDTRFRCASSTAIAAGATHADGIIARVRVDASAATGSPVNNVVLVEGGGENEFRTPTPDERADFEGNPADLPVCDPAITQNACRLPTAVQLSASVSGTVWFDQGSELGLLDGSDRRLSGWIVEVVDAAGQIVGTATTGADGSYAVADQVPGVPLQVRFRYPATGILWGWPVSGETASGAPAPCDATTAIANGTASSCRSDAGGNTHLAVVLAPGANLPQQSLPLNPGGVVYDAVTRNPVPGSRVTLSPVGTCAGYAPEQHVLNAGAGGYTIQGTSVSMTVTAEGFYQFLLGPSAPASCRFAIEVTPPPGYTFQSGMIPAETAPLTPPATPGVGDPVQSNATAPTGPVGTATTYYLEVTLGSAVATPVHNHIPLDPQVAPGLVITKTGDRKTVEVGDSLVYTITIRQTAGAALGTVNVVDRLPHGFTFINGTARVDGAGIADPVGKPGPTLVFDVGPLAVGAQKTLSYRVRVGVGSMQGDGINRARAHGCSITGGCVDPTTLVPYPDGGVVPSNPAEYRVIVSGGVFTDEGCVLGKIFVDCNVNHVQDREEIGIPGVRMYFEDGTWMVSDSEGKYSYCGLPPKSHTLKVDASTLPVGSRLTTSSNRNLGDADSLFIDLKNGELHRADFIEGSCSNPVMEQVKARRTQGEVRASETERNQQPLRFDSKPARAPRQATDSANQRPIVAPRPTDTGGNAGTEVQP
ncbi:SpaA isopeptide-forming pilin-related protein [Pseudoxanthomonas sp. SL93]|uniref:SdrD B-like domain-containing protein n=1 Tax=Pseudoxanthomonas sp. SL93 TaxID=2995142 RepID=UPI00226F6C01|nr:SdrD B-like domain-containing protein [Pseudoxanthomonas sp. SL93]WAC62203.1 SpaA isopeptide-forming pilin-related protein [Pseudoxanthomonas sp. SL93]